MYRINSFLLLCLIAAVLLLPNLARASQNGPEGYVVFSMPVYQDTAIDSIAHLYGTWNGGKYAIGAGLNLSYLGSPYKEVEQRLCRFLQRAQQLSIPVLVELEGINYWQAYPELWNWWDKNSPGYSPDNRKNVEWYAWTPDSAVRIGWRNWGRQHRVLPMPNLSSPTYLRVCLSVLRRLTSIIAHWYKALPPHQKYLFIGIQLGTELSIGTNNWYYPNGNQLALQPDSLDPSYGLQTDRLPDRGVKTIGYAAVATAGIAHSGKLKEEQVTEAVRRYVKKLCQVTQKQGIPRQLLFTHGGGWAEGESIYTVADNRYSCPCWSLYGEKSQNPSADHSAMKIMQYSTAPWWSIGEWLLFGDQSQKTWEEALSNSFATGKLRYLQIRHWGLVKDNKAALGAVSEFAK